MTEHLDVLRKMRTLARLGRYAEVVQIGRTEQESGRSSAQMLVLMANAALLGDEESDGSLEEIREWLKLAIDADPSGLEAKLELGHYMAVVLGDLTAAARAFDEALSAAVAFAESAADGLASSSGDARPAVAERLEHLATRLRRQDI